LDVGPVEATVMEDFGYRHPVSQRLVILGVDGVLGANLALALSDRFAVLGLHQDRDIRLDGCQTAPWNRADRAALERQIRQHAPHWAIYCGPLACSSWDAPEQVPESREEAETVSLLASVCAEFGSRLTVLSTDAVFAGPRLFHAEEDPAFSRRPFARAARQAEQTLRDTGALLVRTCAYGWSPSGAEPGFAQGVWQSLREGACLALDSHRHATPILATDLAELLWLAYRRGLRGLYHIAGAERTSAYRFGGELAAAFGLTSCVTPACGGLLQAPDPDPLQETALATRRARSELGRPMPMLRDGLDRFAEQAVNGFRARLRPPAPPVVFQEAAA
jgi:dTDP-4-dehydrorhamnose reductase